MPGLAEKAIRVTIGQSEAITKLAARKPPAFPESPKSRTPVRSRSATTLGETCEAGDLHSAAVGSSQLPYSEEKESLHET